MSHNIFGNRFVSVREPAWHQLGTVVEDQITAMEALKVAGLDYEYQMTPLVVNLPDGTVLETDKVAVLRSPTSDDPEWRTFGVVSKNYQVLPNKALAEGLDALATVSGWKFETAGALDKGRRVFMTLSTGQRSVKNDVYDSYVVVTDAKGTGESLQILMAPTRVVCQNTLIMAKDASTMNIRLRHNTGLANDYQFWTKMLHRLETQQNQMFTTLDIMAGRKLKDDEFDEFAASVFPMPKENETQKRLEALGVEESPTLDKILAANEYWTSYSIEHRAGLKELYERFNDSDENTDTKNSEFAGTAYAALQAATEIADWGGRDSKTATQSALFGSRAGMKQRAWSAAEALL